MAQLTWGETKSIIQELETLYQDSTDVADLEDFKTQAAKLHDVCDTHARDAKELIKSFAARIAADEAALSPPDQQQHAAAVESTELHIESAASSIEQLQVRAAAVAAEAAAATAALSDTQQLAATAAQEHTVEMPRVANAISLYANISHIQWDYREQDGAVAGWITLPATEQVHRFKIDTASTSSDWQCCMAADSQLRLQRLLFEATTLVACCYCMR
eukprot:7498-Heterococcus_DN1.PRE.1